MSNGKLMLFSSYLQMGKNEEMKSYDSCLSELGIILGTLRYDYISSQFYEKPFLAVNFEEEIKEIAKRIGFSLNKEKPYHIPVLGYTKCGKTLFGKLINEMLKKKKIKSIYVSSEDFMEEEDDEITYDEILDYAPNYDVIIIDDIWAVSEPIETINNILKSMENGALITIWKYLNYSELEDEIFHSIGNTLTEVRINPLKKENRRELFNKIWDIISRDKKKKENLKTVFYDIFEECLGFPGVTIQIFLDIINRFCMDNEDYDLEKFAEEMLRSYNIGKIKDLKLDTVRVDILKIMLMSKDTRGTTPSTIAETIKKDSATVTYHLLKLKNDGIVEDLRFGKNVFYKVKGHYIPFLERIIVESGDDINE